MARQKQVNKQVRVIVKLIPVVERLAQLRGQNFSQCANYLIEKGVNAQEINVTPARVTQVLPGFSTKDLIELATTILTIVGSRGDEPGIEGQMAIAAWEKVVSGEKLDIPDYSRIAKALDISLEEVQKAIEVENALGMGGLDAGKSGS